MVINHKTTQHTPRRSAGRGGLSLPPPPGTVRTIHPIRGRVTHVRVAGGRDSGPGDFFVVVLITELDHSLLLLLLYTVTHGGASLHNIFNIIIILCVLFNQLINQSINY